MVLLRSLRKLIPGESRSWWGEALHGYAHSPGNMFATSGEFSYATSFPAPITMGAAFDDPLIRQVGGVISTEARAFNNHNFSGELQMAVTQFLSPD